jgi:DNA-binding beta-propeller fold protein YncE
MRVYPEYNGWPASFFLVICRTLFFIMKRYCSAAFRSFLVCVTIAVSGAGFERAPFTRHYPSPHHYLYVAAPGVRNYLQYGGHGLLVFDMDHQFKFVKRIATGGLDDKGQPSNVKGVAVSHGCPCHGIALTPDENELWLADGFNEALHVFALTAGGIRQTGIIKLSDRPGWVTFSPDGKYALPSTGNIIDAKTKKIVATLQDETGAHVQSEKMVEVQLDGDRPVRVRDQFGIGRRGK